MTSGWDAVYSLALCSIAVLDVLGFVYDEHLPFLFLQYVGVRAHHTVCREDNVGILAVLVLQVTCRTVIYTSGQLRSESLHLRLPVVQQTCRHYYKRFLLIHCALFLHFCQKCNDLQGLAKTHVISYDTAEAYFHIAIHP